MSSVKVFGPNLSGPAQRKGYNHVHAADCADNKHYGPGRKYGGEDNGYAIDVASRKEIVEFLYPPGEFDYDLDSEWKGYDDLYVAPCLKLAAEVS